MADSSTVERCRICDRPELDLFLDLGSTPLANAFVEPARAAAPEPRFPLEVVRCRHCGLVQLSVVVNPEILFNHYLYQTSASAPMIAHFDDLAADLAARFAPPGALVVEMGSNDGVLLSLLQDRGASVLGVEPARNLSSVAAARGVETWTEFFGPAVAARIADERGRAKVVVGNNVLAHIANLRGVATALDTLLDDDGVFVAEVPYLGALLEKVEYDTIYHEHLSYFAIAPLETLFALAGLEIFDVAHISAHGGSIRVYAGRFGRRSRTERFEAARAAEDRMGLGQKEMYLRFADRVRASREALRTAVDDVRSARKRIAGLGATAKSCTLLNYCGIGADAIEFIADSTPDKQGRLAPGTHIPVREEQALLAELPDYALLLAWNYADSILERHKDYISRGGRFIHPIPLAHMLPS